MSLFKTESQRITVWSVHQLSRVCLITYKQDTCRNENASFNWLIIVWEVLVRPSANWNGLMHIFEAVIGHFAFGWKPLFACLYLYHALVVL